MSGDLREELNVQWSGKAFDGIEIKGYIDSWSSISCVTIEGSEGEKVLALMESDTYGDETCCLVCDMTDGITVLTETYDDIETAIEELFEDGRL